MKTQIRNKKISIIVSILILVILAGSVATALYFSNKKETEQTPAPTTIEDRPVGEVNYDTPNADEENPTLDPPKNTIGQDASIGVSITYTGGSPLQIRALIDEVLSTGTCKLTITDGSKEVFTQTADVFPSSNSTTCKGFTVSPSLNKGTYTVKITVDSDNKKGAATKEITI